MTSGPRTGIWLFPDAPAGRVVDALAGAETVGLDEVWVGDEGPARDPVALLAATAVRTRRLRLGVGVTNPYLRHPALTASQMVTVHELSGGRAVLGLGPGGRLSLDPVGIEPSTPLADCRRALAVIRGVTRREAVDGYRPPAHAVHAPDLPVYVGARGERFNRWASAEADGAFVAGVAPALLDAVIGWARSVRPVAIGLYVSVLLDDHDLEEVRPRMIHAFVDGPAALRRTAGMDDDDARRAAAALLHGEQDAASALLTDDVLDLVLWRGGPATLAPRVAALARRHGPDAIGLSLLGRDPLAQVDRAAAVLHAVRRELA